MFQTKLYVDEAWMKRLSLGLKRFKKIKKNVHACRCPMCGDSKSSPTVTKFYFYVRGGQLNVQCKKCGYSKSFFNFVKDFAPNDFDEYKKETLLHSFKTKKHSSKETEKQENLIQSTNHKPEFNQDITSLKHTINCSDLDETHPAKVYLYNRKFSLDQIERLLYTDDFKSVASQMDKEASKKLLDNEPRIVIPFYDRDGKIKIIQGRALNDTKMKYITIKVDDDVDKTYGLEQIDPDKTVYCVEGPLDSLFVDNCIATCDSNLTRSHADVLIFDNEPRNPEIVNLISQAIEQGRSVVIWPNSPNQKMDINDLVKSGISKKMLMAVIRKRTFKGLLARLEFNKWKKV